MILLTCLNGQSMAVNSDLIKSIEGLPDTVITLITGEKLVVREEIREIVSRVLAFRRAILSTEPMGSSLAHHHLFCGCKLGSDTEDR